MTGFLTLATPASVYPISLDEAKAHLRVRGSREDSYISGLIGAAFSAVEEHTGRGLITQTWDYKISQPSWIVTLPLAPVASITSMTYYDADDASQSLTVSDFYLYSDSDKAFLEPKSSVDWPTVKDRADALTIRFVAGYGSAGAVPLALKQAGLLLLGHWFENRMAVAETKGGELPLAYNYLIAQHRLGWVA